MDSVEASLDELYSQVWNDHLETNQPKEIFHYTSAEGLCGIITTRLLFACDVFCMQDPSEFQQGKSVLMDVLKTRSDKVSRSLLAGFSENPLFPHTGKNWSVYSVSFCGTQDLLGQWRAYGGVGGYAIGMPLAALLKHPRRFTVLRMLYDAGKQCQVFDQLVSESIKIFERYRWPGQEDKLLTEIGRYLIMSIFNMKNPAFRGEDEWRILMLEPYENVNLPVRYRISSGRIVPYIELQLETDWISRIVFGPTVARYPNENAITRMLSASGFESVKCEVSAIPFSA